MNAKEALCHLVGSFMGYKQRCNSEMTLKDNEAIEILNDIVHDDKYAWHDLRKNPNDVPEIGEKVLTTGKNHGYEVQIFHKHHVYTDSEGKVSWSWKWKHNTVKSPIAWKHIQPFEEVAE